MEDETVKLKEKIAKMEEEYENLKKRFWYVSEQDAAQYVKLKHFERLSISLQKQLDEVEDVK